jgi:hypothetical protein
MVRQRIILDELNRGRFGNVSKESPAAMANEKDIILENLRRGTEPQDPASS